MKERYEMSKFIKQLFCLHSSLEEISRERYSVVRGDKSVEGEVTLILCRCKRCGKEKLIPMDRVHFDQEPKVKGGKQSDRGNSGQAPERR